MNAESNLGDIAQRRLLVCHPEKQDLNFDADQCHTSASARDFLSDSENPVAAVVVHPLIEFPYGLHLIRDIHRVRPGIPIYYMQDESLSDPSAPKTLDSLGVHLAIPAGDLERINNSLKIKLEAPIPTKELVKDKQQILNDFEKMMGPEEFVSVPIVDFFTERKSIFDLYLGLPSGRHIRVVQGGTRIPADQIQTYYQKGLQTLFVKRSDQLGYLKACDETILALMQNPNVPPALKFRDAIRYGDTVVQFLQTNGFSKDCLESAQSFVTYTQNLMYKHQLFEKGEALSKFLRDTRMMEHSVATSVLAGVLLHQDTIEWFQGNYHELVGLACLLHDIGLYQLPKKFWDERESELSSIQQKLFRQHPESGARMLQELGMPSQVVDAVAQHHTRLGKLGFPERKGTRPNPIAEIVGLADEIVLAMENMEADDSPQTFLTNRIYEGFSPPVIEALKLSLLS